MVPRDALGQWGYVQGMGSLPARTALLQRQGDELRALLDFLLLCAPAET